MFCITCFRKKSPKQLTNHGLEIFVLKIVFETFLKNGINKTWNIGDFLESALNTSTFKQTPHKSLHGYLFLFVTYLGGNSTFESVDWRQNFR